MGIDWVTFFAQIVNLFVLVWLLKRFLYRPILEAVDKRQSDIMHRVNAAKEEHALAQAEHQQLLEQKMAFESEKQHLFDMATTEANSYKDEQLKSLKQELVTLKTKMQRDLNKEKESVSLQIRNFLAENFIALSEKIMTDLAGTSGLDKNVLLLQSKIDNLSKDEIQNINKILKKQKDIYVYSSNDLSEKSEKELISFFNKKFNITEDIQAHFQKDDSLIFGVQMMIGDIAIEWNLKSYLDDYQTKLNTLLTGLITEE